ncbi:hypothetical protein PPH41_32530 [Burkholderia gladioli]|nr:hypothetical protein [Burkholderia gladioli]
MQPRSRAARPTAAASTTAAARFVEFVLRQKAMADDDADRRGKRGADSGEA